MISDDTKRKLAELYRLQDGYRPAPEIAKQLRDKTVVMLVGATCEGKNTVMDAVVKLDSQFQIVGTRTSREPRPSDEPGRYTYLENTDTGLAPFLQAIERHEAIQYAVNPYAHLIYGSMPADYAATYTIGDFFSSAIANFRQLGFQRTTVITIVTRPDQWLRRFEERFPPGDSQRRARRDEAIESFKWSLAQTEDHYWIENIEGQPERAAQEVIAISLGASEGQLQAKALAASSLDLARKIVA